MEICRKESQHGLGGGQVPERRQPGEAVQGLEQLRERWGAPDGEEKWARRWGQGMGDRALPPACHILLVIQ